MFRYLNLVGLLLLLLLALLGCRDEEKQPLSMGISSHYRVSRLELLSIRGALTDGEYVWRLLGDDSRGGVWVDYGDSVVGRDSEFRRAHADTGTYMYECVYAERGAVMRVPFRVHVEVEFTVYSPYAVDVLDYAPAPGPDVNRLLRLSASDTRDEVLFRCKDEICGPNEGKLSLGAFGGYIVLSFDHMVLNERGTPDLLIFSNVQLAGEDGDLLLANSNPGIVFVGYDRNRNGRPDEDEWYELRGSEHESEGSLSDYSVTYYRPAHEDRGGGLDSMSLARRYDRVEYIAWRDNQGGSGYIPHLQDEHFLSYWPAGEHNALDSLTFRGRCLPRNAEEVVQVVSKGDGTFQTNVSVRRWSLGKGYANNLPLSYDVGLDIADAVDGAGRSVDLPGIEFVRIHTASRPTALGRIAVQATEVAGAADLHMLKQMR